MAAVSLVKPTAGRVHVTLAGSARYDKERAMSSARSCFSRQAVRLLVTEVQDLPPDTLRGFYTDTRWTITAYPAGA